MDILIAVVGLALLALFWQSIKKVSNALEAVLDGVSTNVEDGVKTHGRELKLINAEKRAEQKIRISRMSSVVTNEELDDLLFNKTKTEGAE